jgi:hypothetical protein
MRPFVLLCCFVVSSFAASPEGWERTEVEPGGRIDAIADFGAGVVVLGTRLPTPSNVYRSADLGRTWDFVANVGADDYVTCVAAGAGDVGYILTGAKVHLWKTEDDGLTWRDMGRINDSDSGTNFADAYGMVVTDAGTILVADTDADGGGYRVRRMEVRRGRSVRRFRPKQFTACSTSVTELSSMVGKGISTRAPTMVARGGIAAS